MTGKFVGGLTGSSTMLAEAFHSLADVLNQILLLKGLSNPNRKPISQYKSGFGRARFVWALISATEFFFLGCGMSLWHGIQGLLSHEPHSVKDLHVAITVIPSSHSSLKVQCRLCIQSTHGSSKQREHSF